MDTHTERISDRAIWLSVVGEIEADRKMYEDKVKRRRKDLEVGAIVVFR